MKSKTKIQYFQDVSLEETQTVPENTLSPLRGLYSKDSDLVYSSGSVHSRITGPFPLNSAHTSEKEKPAHSR